MLRRTFLSAALLGVTVAAAACGTPPAPAAPASDGGLPFQDPTLPVPVRVSDLLERLTLEEKASLLVSASPGIPRLDIPAYDWWNESLHGVARAGKATVFPQAIGLAATWDTELMERVATAISWEARAKHRESVRLGSRSTYEGLTFFAPNINLFRDPRWGRGMETYGEDPFLTGRLAVAYVKGLQGDDPAHPRVLATAKHYAVHSGPEPVRHSFDAAPGETDLRESYLPAFHAAVRDGGVLSVMCAYNRLFGDPACASPYLLQDVLRDGWGFRGPVVSDCWAVSDFVGYHHVATDEVEAAARALMAGTDLVCGPEYRSIPQAVERGLVPPARVDQAVSRVLDARFRLGLMDAPEKGAWANVPPEILDSEGHRSLAREAARSSMVLLTNKDGLLPLEGIRTLAVLGPNADDVDVLLGNYNGWPSHPVTPLEGLRSAAQRRGIQLRYARGAALAPGVPALRPVPAGALAGLTAAYYVGHDVEGTPATTRAEEVLDHEWWRAAPLPGLPADTFAVVWRGTLLPSVTGRHALGARVNGSVRITVGDSVVVDATADHGVATPFGWIDLRAGDEYALEVVFRDRRLDARVQLLWAPPAPQDLLDQAVSEAGRADAAVLLLGLSPRLEGEQLSVRVPGFDGGDRVTLGLPRPQEELLRAVVDTGTPTVVVLLSGSALAVPWAADHAGALLQAWYPGQAAGDALADVLFGDANPGGRLPVTVYASADQLPPFESYAMEGRTYRYFRGEPLFPFGHGLSYTRFRYAGLQVPDTVRAGEAFTVSVEVENAGPVEGDEVVQLYLATLSPPEGAPLRTLAGFTRVTLGPGERRLVTFAVDGDALTHVGASHQEGILPGPVLVSVGGKQPGQHGLADAATTQVVSARLEVVR